MSCARKKCNTLGPPGFGSEGPRDVLGTKVRLLFHIPRYRSRICLGLQSFFVAADSGPTSCEFEPIALRKGSKVDVLADQSPEEFLPQPEIIALGLPPGKTGYLLAEIFAVETTAGPAGTA